MSRTDRLFSLEQYARLFPPTDTSGFKTRPDNRYDLLDLEPSRPLLFDEALSAADRYERIKERFGLSKERNTMPSSQVPAGVLNPANLYNDAYADRPPLPWASAERQDKMDWIGEQVAYKVIEWFAVRNVSPETAFTGPTMAHIAVIVGEEETASCDVDCLNLWLNPDLVVHMLRRAANPHYVPEQIAPYPGYEERHPSQGNPIGPPLTKQPWKGRTLYEDDLPDAYPVGAVFPDPTGDRYTKVSYVSVPGQGPFGSGGKTATAWERTYKA